MEQPKRRKPGPKGPRLGYSRNTPAYRIVYGVFGSIAEFCRQTGEPHGTVHWWLANSGLIADANGRWARIQSAAAAMGKPFDAALFEPDAKAA